MPVTQIEKYSSSLRELDCAGSFQRNGELVPYDRSNQEPLLAVRTGSRAAFEELQKLYSNRLYRRILSITRNHEDAEDALQDTFMRAFLAFDSFRGRSHVSTWLTRIAINSALMVIRPRCRAYAEVSLTASSKPEADFQEFNVRDSAPTPEEVCDLKQRFDIMFSAIERLDPTLRNAIGIQITQEYSMKEMARTLGLSVAAVKARLHRARKTLAKQIDNTGIRRNSLKQSGFELTTQNRAAICLTCD
jgi:RNA polymerase sigma-70 factor (ECF subfamily)